jgi:hypothetical protein
MPTGSRRGKLDGHLQGFLVGQKGLVRRGGLAASQPLNGQHWAKRLAALSARGGCSNVR